MLEKKFLLSNPLPIFKSFSLYGKGALIFSLSFFLIACGSNLAPVSELKWQAVSKNSTRHVVQKDETLFAIAFRYDKDYKQLAAINHLYPPYALRVGQVLQLNTTVLRAAPRVLKPTISQTIPIKTSLKRHTSSWLWPVRGRILSVFSPSQGKKGIDIACNKGDKVFASATGVVAYAGSGLTGYGNLIIIKHDNDYLTAYGNNSLLYVAEGQKVEAGQLIARAGRINRQYFGVHFEIRKRGTPVNPLNYL